MLLDQPIIVTNAEHQRPVENLVSSPIGRRYGGMQPAYTGKTAMFGKGAPVWPFLNSFGGPANPLRPVGDTRGFETYPALAMVALDWMLPDTRATGRLPKYNPERRSTFSIEDWLHVCCLASCALRERALTATVQWIDQDKLDACLCLLVALHLAERKACLMAGDLLTGYIVVPYGDILCEELATRCQGTGRDPAGWLQRFQLAPTAP